MKTALILPDIHHPKHSKKCLKAIWQWLRDYGKKLDYLILLGDQMEFETVSFWLKNKKRILEGKRIIREYRQFDSEILCRLDKAVSNKCRKIYFIGNHEVRIDSAIDEDPNLEGYLEIENNLHLKKRKWKVIRFNHFYKLGKLSLMHGMFWNKYHAAKSVEECGRSVLYGHSHDIQEFTKNSLTNEVHKGKSIGCLCDTNPDWKKGRPNRWVNAFSVVYVYGNGFFNEYTVNIINGKFVWAGKLYE